MRSPILIRKINNMEKKILLNAFSDISSKVKLFFAENQSQFFMLLNKNNKENYPEIFFVSKDLIKILDNSNLKSKIIFLGVYFGFIKRGRLHLSIEGGDFLNNKDLIPVEKKIKVNKEGEKAILYGNNIIKSMLAPSFFNHINSIQEGQIFFIFNVDDEILCIGKASLNERKLNNIDEKNILLFQNLSDKGIYLRIKQ